MRTLTFNRIVGSGAMGTVYHAELGVPRGFTRQCAVKVMKTAGPDHEHFRGRMRDEARLLGMLQDEQILGVSELVQVEGRDAVIMEFVEGVDLSDVVRGQPLPPKALAELGAEVAGTVYRAHTATHPKSGEPLHVIHRDVKPANIMITSRGGVRVLDFGVARAVFASRESHTQGLVLGTLNYFPPEILVGQDPTPAVDIYGVGLTMWECATGKEWGAPRVQRAQFERRVDQRLSELSEDYRPILPVLRQVLQWDPQLRPDGGALERMLLAAAEQCSGQGLRVWSREVVPGMLARQKATSREDPLLGRTVSIDLMLPDEPTVAPPAKSPPRGAPARAAVSRPLAAGEAFNTYDDLGPAAAVKRLPEAAPKKAAGRQRPAAAENRVRRGERPAPASGVSLVVIVGVGLLIGLVAAMLILVVLLLVVIVAL